MASKSVLVCDIHQDEGEDVKTRRIAVDGLAFRLELCDKAYRDEPLARILEAGKALMKAARPRQARTPTPRPPQASTATSTVAPGVPPVTLQPPTPPTAPAADDSGSLAYSSVVRSWARHEGMQVGANGKMKQSVIDAYIAAHS